MKIEVELKGQQEMVRAFKMLGANGPKAMGAALWKEGNNIMNAAKEITPVKFGVLKNSGIVNLPEISGDTVSVTMGFGGAASDYAVLQHEEASFYHTPPTQYKFLEQPFKEAQDGMEVRIAQDLWDKLK
jgi:hypothetical protein